MGNSTSLIAIGILGLIVVIIIAVILKAIEATKRAPIDFLSALKGYSIWVCVAIALIIAAVILFFVFMSKR